MDKAITLHETQLKHALTPYSYTNLSTLLYSLLAEFDVLSGGLNFMLSSGATRRPPYQSEVPSTILLEISKPSYPSIKPRYHMNKSTGFLVGVSQKRNLRSVTFRTESINDSWRHRWLMMV